MQTDLPEGREAEKRGLETRQALYRLATLQRREGRFAEAIETLKKLESLHPPFGGMFEELGLCLLAANEPAKALLAFQRAVDLNICLLDSWRVLEALYRACGRLPDAQNAAAQWAQLAGLPEGIRSACSHYFDGEKVAAEEQVRSYLATHGEHTEALRLLAKIATDAGAEYDAELLLQRALALAPHNEAARHELALVLLKREKHGQAREQIDKLLRLSPTPRRYRYVQAAAAVAVGDYKTALPLYGELLQETPRDPDLYLAIGNALKTTGKTQEAIDSYHLAANARPGFGEAFWALANLKTYPFTDAEIALMRAQEASPTGTPVDRYHFCFALGKALEDRGHFAESFGYYERGNAQKRATLRYRPESLEHTARQQISLCTPEFFAARRGFGCDSYAPIFIVGLPRSGSTLIEQILAAHSQVDGTLELANIPRLVQELQSSERAASVGYPGMLGALPAEACRRFGEQYVRDAAVYRNDKAGVPAGDSLAGRSVAPRPHFTDKMPNNFRHLGLIELILPNAKIVDVRREPMSCCFSIYKQLFANGQRFAYSLEDIARYYRTYVELMAHWERVLPGKILRVQYEDVVNDLAPSVRRILDFCGLGFEPDCVEFHRSRRSVHTPSSEQVRRPVYKEGIDQWRHYERWLQPLKRNLALDHPA